MSINPTTPPIERLSREGYQIPIGDFIGKGWAIVKDNLGLFIAYTLIFIVINAISGMIPFVGNLASLALQGPLVIGFAIAAHKVTSRERLELNDFFKGFSQFVQLLLTTLLTGIATAACFLPFVILFIVQVGVVGFEDLIPPQGSDSEEALEWVETIVGIFTSPLLIIGILVSTVLALIVSALLIFAPYYVYFYNLSAMDALQASFKVVKRQLGGMVLFIFVTGLVVAAGAIACGIGVLITIPIGLAAYYVAFATINDLGAGQIQKPLDTHLVG